MSGRPLVLTLPAQLTDAWSWERVAALVTPFADVAPIAPPPYAPDEPPEASLEAYERALADRVRTEARVRPVALAGASVGGYFAARVAERHPSALAHLFLLGTLARLPDALDAARIETAAGLETGALPLEAVLSAVHASVATPDERDAELDRLLSNDLAKLSREELAWNLRLTSPLARDARRVRELGLPTTVLHGRRDACVPFACGEELAALGGAVRFVPIDTSSHLLSMTHPERVAAEMRAALAR